MRVCKGSISISILQRYVFDVTCCISGLQSYKKLGAEEAGCGLAALHLHGRTGSNRRIVWS